MIKEDKPSIVRSGSHTAVCLGKKRLYWWLIPMSNKTLRVFKLTDKEMVNQGWEPMSYLVRDVAKKYLKHGAGVGPVAEKILVALANQDEQLELALEEVCDSQTLQHD